MRVPHLSDMSAKDHLLRGILLWYKVELKR